MSELPKDWLTTHLDNVAIVQGGYAFKSKDFQSTGTPVLRISNIAGLNDGLDNSCARINPTKLAGLERFQLSKGDIVVAMSGATTGKYGVFNLNETVFLNQRVGRINTKNAATLDQRYLFHYFGLLQKRILDAAYGAAQPNISPKEIAEFEIPLPPLPEQRRIVARIEELFSHLDAGVSALRHAKAQLQRYRQSVLAAAVTGQLTQAWREQHPDTESGEELLKRILKDRREQWSGRGKYKEAPPLDVRDLPEVPGSWLWATTAQIFTEIKDGTHDTPKYHASGIPFITQKHIKPQGLVFDDYKFISQADHDHFYTRSNPEEGDILISMIGVNRGQSCVVPSTEVFSIKNVGLFKPHRVLTNVKFLQASISSLPSQKRLLKRSKGGAQPFVGLNELRTWALPLPPLDEQHQIVAEVEARTTAIDHLEAELDRQITRSNRLRQSTLASAFRGAL